MKFQVDGMKIVRVLLLAELKNAVMRKMRLKIQCAYLFSGAFDVEGCKNKMFPGTRPFVFHFWIPKVHFNPKKNQFFQNST